MTIMKVLEYIQRVLSREDQADYPPTYDKQAGPFQPVRLIVNVDGSWSLQCPVYEHVIIK